MDKTINNKAWFLVLPVFAIVAFSAVFAADDCRQLFDAGYVRQQSVFLERPSAGSRNCSIRQAISASGFSRPLGRNLMFSAIILAIGSAARHRRGAVDAARRLACRGVSRHDGAAVADSMERGRHDLADFRTSGYRPARLHAQSYGHRLQLRLERFRCVGHGDRDGCLALDQPRGAALLCRSEVDSRRLLSGGADRWRIAPGPCFAQSNCRR